MQLHNEFVIKRQMQEFFQREEACRSTTLLEVPLAHLALQRGDGDPFWHELYMRGLCYRAEKAKIEQRKGNMYIFYFVEGVWVMDSVK